jgi:hypothetical protein
MMSQPFSPPLGKQLGSTEIKKPIVDLTFFLQLGREDISCREPGKQDVLYALFCS